MPKLFGQKLQHLRRVHSMTQGDLASRLGLATPSHISNIEAGRKKPSIELVIRTAYLFQEQTDYLLQDTINPTESAARIMSSATRPQAKRLSKGELEQYKQRLGRTLRELRYNNRIILSELAKQVGMTAAQLEKVEIAQGEISVDAITNLANLFSVTTDYLLLPATDKG